MAEPEEMKLKEIEQVYGLLKVIKEYIDWANADNLDALSSSRFKKIIDEIYKRRGIEHEDISGSVSWKHSPKFCVNGNRIQL